jgi:DNA-binding transcriptional regulator WhiA
MALSAKARGAMLSVAFLAKGDIRNVETDEVHIEILWPKAGA